MLIRIFCTPLQVDKSMLQFSARLFIACSSETVTPPIGPVCDHFALAKSLPSRFQNRWLTTWLTTGCSRAGLTTSLSPMQTDMIQARKFLQPGLAIQENIFLRSLCGISLIFESNAIFQYLMTYRFFQSSYWLEIFFLVIL